MSRSPKNLPNHCFSLISDSELCWLPDFHSSLNPVLFPAGVQSTLLILLPQQPIILLLSASFPVSISRNAGFLNWIAHDLSITTTFSSTRGLQIKQPVPNHTEIVPTSAFFPVIDSRIACELLMVRAQEPSLTAVLFLSVSHRTVRRRRYDGGRAAPKPSGTASL